MAILMPVARRARNHVRAVVCQSNLKQWGTTLALYAEDNKGCLPAISEAIRFFRGSYLNNDDPFDPTEENKYDKRNIAICPMASRLSKNASYGNFIDGGIDLVSIYGFQGLTFNA